MFKLFGGLTKVSVTLEDVAFDLAQKYWGHNLGTDVVEGLKKKYFDRHKHELSSAKYKVRMERWFNLEYETVYRVVRLYTRRVCPE